MQLVCARGRVLDLARPVVMGVLNVTADSFSDGGRFRQPDDAIAQGLRLAEEGAAILDVGGESTRPGAEPVSLQEELDRVVPVIEALAARSQVLVSVDTMKPEVMREAVAAGAGLINDVQALGSGAALQAAAASGAAVCLMHMQGTPRTMQQDPQYGDVVREVGAYLRQRLQACMDAGVAPERICLDPGFGFGKTLTHNLQLLERLEDVALAGRPLLVGLSRKSMLGALLGREVAQRLPGSLALALEAVSRGAVLVRTHDVAATLDVIRVHQALAHPL